MRKSPFEHIRRSTLIRNERKTLFSRISFLFGFFCVIGAFLAPSDIPDTTQRDGVIIPIIDNSLSMAVPDVGYKDGSISRFQAAKEFIRELVRTHPDYSYGLFAFNSNPRIVAPITNAHETVLNLLNGLGSASYQGGSNMTHMTEMIETLYASGWDNSPITAIVLTDGGEEGDIDKLSSLPRYPSIQWHIIGIGKEVGGQIPTGNDLFGNPTVKMFSGKSVISRRYDSNIHTFATTLRSTQSTLEHTDDIMDILDTLPLSHQERKQSFGFTPPGTRSYWIFFAFLFLTIGIFFPRYDKAE